ncbi:MAG TPA: hypothetical protein EYQ74_05425 [Planctomycetes bacterium]|nr:hypothetical protein [Planctomycetota bacterium]HIK60753.1 hypothetical protein [Planctomycetota bacterium]
MTPLVRRVWTATRLACTAEALLLGSGISLLTLAAAWGSGAGGGWTALGLALMAGVIFGISWRIEQRPHLQGVAQGVDEGLRLGGALVTAFESEQAGEDGPLLRLLSLRVRSRVRVVQALRAALPNSLPFLAAPLLGTVVLLSVRGGGEEPDRPVAFLAPALGAMADALGEAKRMGFEDVAAGLTSQERVSLLANLEREARALAEKGERSMPTQGPGSPQAKDLSEQLDRMEEKLEGHLEQLDSDFVVDVPEGTETQKREAPRRAIERALAHLDSARHALSQASSGFSSGVDPEQGSGGLGAEHEGMGGAGGDNSPGSLASGDESGTMVPPPITPESHPGSTPEAQPQRGGLSGAGIWPARHRELVGSWARTLAEQDLEAVDH